MTRETLSTGCSGFRANYRAGIEDVEGEGSFSAAWDVLSAACRKRISNQASPLPSGSQPRSSRSWTSSLYAARADGLFGGGSPERHEKDVDSAISVQIPSVSSQASATNRDRK